jgi:hypothetical protein
MKSVRGSGRYIDTFHLQKRRQASALPQTTEIASEFNHFAAFG